MRGVPRARVRLLGLPLPALLALWLVLNDDNPPDDPVVERSSLYRRLVDLTTRYGGNIEPISPAAPKITGDELRDLLQRTAVQRRCAAWNMSVMTNCSSG